jgi:hypothetical protein
VKPSGSRQAFSDLSCWAPRPAAVMSTNRLSPCPNLPISRVRSCVRQESGRCRGMERCVLVCIDSWGGLISGGSMIERWEMRRQMS